MLLSPAFLRAVELGQFKLPWWAFNAGGKGVTHELYFRLAEPVSIEIVQPDESVARERFLWSNQLMRRLLACEETGAVVRALRWGGCRLGSYALFRLNFALQRHGCGLRAFWRVDHHGRWTKWAFEAFLAWLELRPLLIPGHPPASYYVHNSKGRNSKRVDRPKRIPRPCPR